MNVDTEFDPRLEERLRRTLRAVADQTRPTDAGAALVVAARSNGRSGRSPRLLAAAVLVVTGVGAFIATRAGDSPVRLTQTAGQSSEASSSVTTIPPTTMPGVATTVASPPLDRDSGAVGVWRDLVTESLVFVFDPAPTIEDAYLAGGSTQTPNFAALVRFQSKNAVLLADYQLFADGEYRADPEWQQEVAGSTSAGVEVEEGRLFVTDEPGDGLRRAVLVTAGGVLSVNAEYVVDREQPSSSSTTTPAASAAAALPTVDELTKLARNLAIGAQHLNPE